MNEAEVFSKEEVARMNRLKQDIGKVLLRSGLPMAHNVHVLLAIAAYLFKEESKQKEIFLKLCESEW